MTLFAFCLKTSRLFFIKYEWKTRKELKINADTLGWVILAVLRCGLSATVSPLSGLSGAKILLQQG